MIQVWHYVLIVCDDLGERMVGSYDSLNPGLGLDELARQVRFLAERYMTGQPIGEGWVQLKCVEDDTKSVMVGLI
jgi:hypothetical protein